MELVILECNHVSVMKNRSKLSDKSRLSMRLSLPNIERIFWSLIVRLEYLDCGLAGFCISLGVFAKFTTEGEAEDLGVLQGECDKVRLVVFCGQELIKATCEEFKLVVDLCGFIEKYL